MAIDIQSIAEIFHLPKEVGLAATVIVGIGGVFAGTIATKAVEWYRYWTRRNYRNLLVQDNHLSHDREMGREMLGFEGIATLDIDATLLNGHLGDKVRRKMKQAPDGATMLVLDDAADHAEFMNRVVSAIGERMLPGEAPRKVAVFCERFPGLPYVLKAFCADTDTLMQFSNKEKRREVATFGVYRPHHKDRVTSLAEMATALFEKKVHPGSHRDDPIPLVQTVRARRATSAGKPNLNSGAHQGRGMNMQT